MEEKYLNEKALMDLIRQVTTGSDPESREDQEALESLLPSFHAYVNAVIAGETRLLMNPHAAGRSYQEMVTEYDQDRHSAHETAILNVRVLNRLAELYKLSPVFTGDSAQRHQVAAFCMEMDQFLFRNRRMKLS